MVLRDQMAENELQSANKFVKLGNPELALVTMYAIFNRKKWTYHLGSARLESLMFKYLDLCVELKMAYFAKRGLSRYEKVCRLLNNAGSLENAIRRYLNSAQQKIVVTSREGSLPNNDGITPTSSLISVNNNSENSRNECEIPRVNFLWKSYHQCLELLRKNITFESLYHDIARMAFQFCLTHNRKMEFRKLCDELRNHLENIIRLPSQEANVSLTRPETQQRNLETRSIQLDYAIQMELWQEAYKTIEDLNNLMMIPNITIESSEMVNYYLKLSAVFWNAGPNYYVFHAAALFKLYLLNKEMNNTSRKELRRISNQFLSATLCIPLHLSHFKLDNLIKIGKKPDEIKHFAMKPQKLANLLWLTELPTRFSLLNEIVRHNVLSLTLSPLQELYACLEVDFNPSKLCHRVDDAIKNLKCLPDLQQYISPLRDVTLVTLIRDTSRVYETISYDRLLSLAHFTTQFHMERLIVDCVRQNKMQIRIDQVKRLVYFDNNFNASQPAINIEDSVTEYTPYNQIRDYLINMLDVLIRCRGIIDSDLEKKNNDFMNTLLVKHYRETEHLEREKILQRRNIAAKRNEYITQLKKELRRMKAENVAHRKQEELQKKLKTNEIAFDHLERAKRIEEIRLLKQTWKENQIQREKTALQHRNRLQRMAKDGYMFIANLQEKRRMVCQEECEKVSNTEEKLKQTVERTCNKRKDTQSKKKCL